MLNFKVIVCLGFVIRNVENWKTFDSNEIK